MRTPCLVLVLTCLGTQLLGAQTRLSGEGTCADPEVEHSIPVGDRPNHVFSISQTKCTWTKPFEIAGLQAKGGTGVQSDEVSGNICRFHGYFLDTMANGDTAHYRYQGTTNLRDGKPYSATWSWTLAGGSGKLKNVTGKGSCRGAWDAERVYKWHCVGGYQLGR